MELTADVIDQVVRAALAEDVGTGDVTTEAVVSPVARCGARLLLEEAGVVCGVPLAEAVFTMLDASVRVEREVEEGVWAGVVPVVVATLEGSARAILTGERTALNLVGRLCGIASLTCRYVEAVKGTGATILDTRKTTPGLRALEKYAVRCGGGGNHRFGLHDAILVKENHLRLAGGIAVAVAALRERRAAEVEVEVETLDDVREALEVGVERILLDNMTPQEIARAVEIVDGRATLEASGGVSLGTVRAYAEAGVDYISVGALTHAARSLRVSLDVQ